MELQPVFFCITLSFLSQFAIKLGFTVHFLTEEEQNDQLLYDPKMDDDDQMWVDKKRASYHPSLISGASNSQASTGNTKTDAVLNCPACMCAVCLDCQR